MISGDFRIGTFFSKEYMIPSHFSLVKEFIPSAKLISKLSSNQKSVFQMRLQLATVLGEWYSSASLWNEIVNTFQRRIL